MIRGIALIVALAFVIYYVVDSRNYVTTNNAQVDGNQISIKAPATGTLMDWKGQQGAEVQSTSRSAGSRSRRGYFQPQMVIRAPAREPSRWTTASRAASSRPARSWRSRTTAAGVFVTARVDETEVDAVHPGASVKIDVDAFPDADLTGHVSEVQTGAAACSRSSRSPTPRATSRRSPR